MAPWCPTELSRSRITSMPKRPVAQAIATMFNQAFLAVMPVSGGDVPGRKVIPALPAPIMATLTEAGERLGGRNLKPATREDVLALFKKKAA